MTWKLVAVHFGQCIKPKTTPQKEKTAASMDTKQNWKDYNLHHKVHQNI